jgi:hypothetical protein
MGKARGAPSQTEEVEPTSMASHSEPHKTDLKVYEMMEPGCSTPQEEEDNYMSSVAPLATGKTGELENNQRVLSKDPKNASKPSDAFPQLSHIPNLRKVTPSNPYKKLGHGGGLTPQQENDHLFPGNSSEAFSQHHTSPATASKPFGKPDSTLKSSLCNLTSEKQKAPSVSFSHRIREIQLKDNQERPYIHRFVLKIETNKTDMEAECERLIQKQLQLFHSLILQVDNTALIPPYLMLDQEHKALKTSQPSIMWRP